jgi:hypothetical protein
MVANTGRFMETSARNIFRSAAGGCPRTRRHSSSAAWTLRTRDDDFNPHPVAQRSNIATYDHVARIQSARDLHDIRAIVTNTELHFNLLEFFVSDSVDEILSL